MCSEPVCSWSKRQVLNDNIGVCASNKLPYSSHLWLLYLSSWRHSCCCVPDNNLIEQTSSGRSGNSKLWSWPGSWKTSAYIVRPHGCGNVAAMYLNVLRRGKKRAGAKCGCSTVHYSSVRFLKRIRLLISSDLAQPWDGAFASLKAHFGRVFFYISA